MQQVDVKDHSLFEPPQKQLRVGVKKRGKGSGGRGRGFAAGGVGVRSRHGKTSAGVPSSEIFYPLLVVCSLVCNFFFF